MWHASSSSGVATLRTAIHLLLTYLLTYQAFRLRATPEATVSGYQRPARDDNPVVASSVGIIPTTTMTAGR